MTEAQEPQRHDFDIVVIGSGPGGQKAAIAAAKLGRRVAVVERPGSIGGVCVNTGTIPSKALREAGLYLSGLEQRELYGQSYRLKDDITMQDLCPRVAHVVAREVDVVRNQLQRNHVALLTGTARFVDPHTLAIEDAQRVLPAATVTAEKIVVAVGTRPARPQGIEFDGRTVIDSDDVLNLDRLPESLLVVGAGVIGAEYASMLAAVGVRVTVVDERETMLEFCDAEIVEALRYHLRDLNVIFRFGERVVSVERGRHDAIATLASGKRIAAEAILYCAGRQGATAGLGLELAGVLPDRRGRIHVDEHFRTCVPHIYAVGDVVGFPALASTSMEQGRCAGHHAAGHPVAPVPSPQPIGIYTIPEISYVGATEAELTASGVPYEVGVARYRELARGQILGDSHGLLKMLVSCDDRTLLGVHVFGHGATELIHIGQTLIAGRIAVDYLVDAIFNYPTLAEAYKVAALDVTNRLRRVEEVAA